MTITKQDLESLTGEEVRIIMESVSGGLSFYENMGMMVSDIRLELGGKGVYETNGLMHIKIMCLTKDKWIWANSISPSDWDYFYMAYRGVMRVRRLNTVLEEV